MTRDWTSLLTSARWPGDRSDVLTWCERPAASARPMRVGLIDASFTTDVEESVCTPLELREFSARPVLRRGSIAEHGTAAACVLAGARWPEGALPGARLSCAMVGELQPALLVDAIRWLADASLDVVALPLGSMAWHDDVALALCELMAGASRPRVFASLGNGVPAPGLFPARMAGIVSVGAGRDDGSLLDPAPPGPRPDIIAPGDRVLVRVGIERMRETTGSSISCAIAAGIEVRKRATSLPTNERG